MHCLYSCRFSSFFSNRLQEVSNTLINRLTMLNKMVTNVFRSVCFALGSKQLKSPFCLASSEKSFGVSFLHSMDENGSFSILLLIAPCQWQQQWKRQISASANVCLWYAFVYISLCCKLISRDYFICQQAEYSIRVIHLNYFNG